MFTTSPLKLMPYAQAKIRRYSDGTVELISYATSVATINPDGWLHITGLYSATTRKHIGAFMKECTSYTYQTARMLRVKHKRLNIYSGDLENED